MNIIELFNELTEWADKFTIWFTFLTLFFVFRNWKNDKKLQENIQISLRYQNKNIYLLQTLRRIHCSRSEIQGLLRAAYGGATYKLSFLAGEEFSQRLKNVQNGELDTLIIDIDENEKEEHNVFQKIEENIKKITSK